MVTEIEHNQDLILAFLNNLANEKKSIDYVSAKEIHEATGLEPLKINQAVELLNTSGQVEWLQTLGTAPYLFAFVKLTARGAYMFQRKQAAEQSIEALAQKRGKEAASIQELLSVLTRRKPPIPEGSPYGFTDRDWEIVSGWKANKNVLCVVLGLKFDSKYCNYGELVKNARNMFEIKVL